MERESRKGLAGWLGWDNMRRGEGRGEVEVEGLSFLERERERWGGKGREGSFMVV